MSDSGMGGFRLANTVAVVANIGVLVGIALLVYELDQNSDAVIGSTQQGLLELLHDSDAWLADRDFAEIVVRAEERGETLTGVEARQFDEWMSGKLNACEHVYERFLEGSLNEYYWEGWSEGCKALLDSPQSRRVWARRQTWYGRSFRAFIDEYVASSPVTSVEAR